MRFSVLVPVYETPIDLLANCVKSIVHQKDKYGQAFTDFEIIIAYDGSTGPNVSLKAKIDLAIKDEKVFYKSIMLDKGTVSSTRNALLDRAQGDWIVWVDSDDTLQHFALETLNKYIEEKQNIYNCFTYKANVFGKDLKYTSSMIDNYVGNYTYSALNTSNEDFFKLPETLWQKCISRKFLVDNKIHFDNEIKLYDDWYFHNVLCMHDLKAYKIDKALYNYNIRDNSLSTNSEQGRSRGYIAVVADSLRIQKEKRAGLDIRLSKVYKERINDYCKEFIEGI